MNDEHVAVHTLKYEDQIYLGCKIFENTPVHV